MTLDLEGANLQDVWGSRLPDNFQPPKARLDRREAQRRAEDRHKETESAPEDIKDCDLVEVTYTTRFSERTMRFREPSRAEAIEMKALLRQLHWRIKRGSNLLPTIEDNERMKRLAGIR